MRLFFIPIGTIDDGIMDPIFIPIGHFAFGYRLSSIKELYYVYIGHTRNENDSH